MVATEEASTFTAQQWRTLQQRVVHPLDLPASDTLFTELRRTLERQIEGAFGLDLAAEATNTTTTAAAAALTALDLQRVTEALAPPPDPRHYLIDRAEHEFAYRIRGARSSWPMLAHITWHSDLECGSIRFDAILEQPDVNFGWTIAAGSYGVVRLFRFLQQLGPAPFHDLWRRTRDAVCHRDRPEAVKVIATAHSEFTRFLREQRGMPPRLQQLVWAGYADTGSVRLSGILDVHGPAVAGPGLCIPDAAVTVLQWPVYIHRREFGSTMRWLDETRGRPLIELYDEMAERIHPGYRQHYDIDRFPADPYRAEWGGHGGARNWRPLPGPQRELYGERELFERARRGEIRLDRGGPEAERRAEKLLREWLSPAQLKQYERERCFEVTGNVSGRRFRIRHGTAYNIDVLGRDGYPEQEICFGPNGCSAAGDFMLAQKITLETNERAALAVANKRPRGGAQNLTATEVAARWIPRDLT